MKGSGFSKYLLLIRLYKEPFVNLPVIWNSACFTPLQNSPKNKLPKWLTFLLINRPKILNMPFTSMIIMGGSSIHLTGLTRGLPLQSGHETDVFALPINVWRTLHKGAAGCIKLMTASTGGKDSAKSWICALFPSHLRSLKVSLVSTACRG